MAVISLPFIALIHAFKKIQRKPFNTPLFTSKAPKYHLIELKEFKRLRQKSYQKTADFLKLQGFEQVATLEDKSRAQGIFMDIWVNQRQKFYATIHINKSIGRAVYTTFAAFTAGNTYFSVENCYAIPIKYPNNLVIHNYPKASLDTIFQKMLDQLRQHKKAPQLLSLPALLSIGTKIRYFSIEQGIKQKLLYTSIKGHPDVTPCYHHPVNMAVRICSVCNMHVCESCFDFYQEKYYCKNCLPQINMSTSRLTTPAAETAAGFAGLGVRMNAWLLDGLFIGAIVAAVYMGLRQGIAVLTPQEAYSSLPFMLSQLIFMALVPIYFIVPLKHNGQTPGMRILGLRVVDQQGRIPDVGAALVRFFYFLFSCLFIFPLIGYLFIMFRKTKQGLHDQLADTLVLTNHPIKKAVVSWSMLLIILAISGGYALQWAKPWLDFLRLFSSGRPTAEVTLEANWVLPFEDENQFLYSFTGRGDRLILTSSTTAQAIDIRTGHMLWTNDSLSNSSIQASSANETLPLLMLQLNDNGLPHLLNIDSETGEIIWRRLVETNEPILIFDAEIILIYDASRLWAYSTSNQLLWSKSFSERLSIDHILLNRNILVVCGSEKTQNLIYLSRTGGDTLWEEMDPVYEIGFSIGQGYQLLYMNDGKSGLMFLPEQRLEWESPQSLGYAIAASPQSASGSNRLADILFTSTSALRTADGAILFSYPAGARYGCLSDSYLILIKDEVADTLDGSASELLVLDQHSGSIKKIFPGRKIISIVKVAEDPSHIYFMAMLKPDRQNAFSAVSELLILDKKSLVLQDFQVGKNIASHQIKIFPRENLIFLPTYQHVGTYQIPPMDK